jgi:hypothetical protein
MTSRTIVSPNSKIEWMRSFSSSSIVPSSVPASAIALSSASETNGPCFRPLPGRITFATPIRSRVGPESSLPRPQTSGATASAAPSEWSTANVLDMASTIRKYRSVNSNDATVIQPVPRVFSARIATRMAEPFCTNITAR